MIAIQQEYKNTFRNISDRHAIAINVNNITHIAVDNREEALKLISMITKAAKL